MSLDEAEGKLCISSLIKIGPIILGPCVKGKCSTVVKNLKTVTAEQACAPE